MHFLEDKSSSGLKIPSLDGIRGIAILFVLLSHLSNEGYKIIDWSGKGKYGVYLFFVLSAFLLSYPFLNKANRRNRASNNKNGLKDFFKRRFYRMFPLFFVITFFDFYLHKKGFSYNNSVYINYSLGDILNHFLLIDLKGIFWAIDVEFKFYMALPLLLFFYKKNAYVFTGLVLLFLLFYYHKHSVFFDYHGYWAGLLKYLPLFLAGIYAADIYSKAKDIKDDKLSYFFEVLSLSLFIFSMFIPGNKYHEAILFSLSYGHQSYYAICWGKGFYVVCLV